MRQFFKGLGDKHSKQRNHKYKGFSLGISLMGWRSTKRAGTSMETNRGGIGGEDDAEVKLESERWLAVMCNCQIPHGDHGKQRPSDNQSSMTSKVSLVGKGIFGEREGKHEDCCFMCMFFHVLFSTLLASPFSRYRCSLKQ